MNRKEPVHQAPSARDLREALDRSMIATDQLREAKRAQLDAHAELVRQVVNLGMYDCLTPKVGMLRRRIRG